ncbi:MAG: hypothetical protein ACHREM_17040 [Polyangiales bacterium]
MTATDHDCQVYVNVRGHEVIIVRDATHDEAVANARLIVLWEHRTAYVRNLKTGVTEAVEKPPADA